MSTDAAKPPPQANVSIESVLGVQQHSVWQRIIAAQSFWVTVALVVICVVMTLSAAGVVRHDRRISLTSRVISLSSASWRSE